MTPIWLSVKRDGVIRIDNVSIEQVLWFASDIIGEKRVRIMWVLVGAMQCIFHQTPMQGCMTFAKDNLRMLDELILVAIEVGENCREVVYTKNTPRSD